MADFYSVSLEEMDALLRPMRFRPVDLTYRNRPVKEWVYQRPLPSRDNHFVRVYTGINRYGQKQNQSRERGKDAIRVQVIYRDPNGTETLVTQPKRVHRVRGWADNLGARLEEINRNRPQVVFDSRGIPMTLRKGKTGWFWGSRDYPRYKETRPFQAELIDFVISPEKSARGWYDGFQDRSYINLANIKNPELIPNIVAHEMAHRAYQPVADERRQNSMGGLSNHVKEEYFNEMNSFLIQEGGDFDRAKIWMLMHPVGALWLSFRLNPEWHDGMERRNWLMPSEEQLQNLQDYLATIDFENNSDLTEMFNEELINRVKNDSINNLRAEMRFELSSFAAFLQIVMDYIRYQETRPFNSESAPLAGQTTEALYEIKIYVPSTNLDQPVSETEFQSRIDETQRKLSELFGGFTTTVGDGGYLSQEEGLISEPVMIVTSWANPKDYQNKLGELESFLREKQQTWGQEVIGFEFENDFFMFPEFEIYEAPYQPDQTMQDYTLSELTTSSAISGYQPYKYSASHGAESEESEFYAGIPIYDINSLEELREVLTDEDFHTKNDAYWLDYNERKARPHSNPLTETHLFRINFSGIYALRSIKGPSKVLFGTNLLQSATNTYTNQFSSYQTYLSPPMEKIRATLPNKSHSGGRGILSAYGPYTSLMSIPQETPFTNSNNIIFDLEGVVFGYHHYAIPNPDGSIQDLSMVGEIEIIGGVPEKNVVYQDFVPKNVLTLEPVRVDQRHDNEKSFNYLGVANIRDERGKWVSNLDPILQERDAKLRKIAKPWGKKYYAPEELENLTVSELRELWRVGRHLKGTGKKKQELIDDLTDDTTDEDFIEYWNQFAAEDNYEATYGKRQAAIRRRLKKKIKAQNVRGTAAGEWSARKSQLLKEKYEAACERANIRPYKGKKTQSQKNLSNWSKQNWRTASGKKSSVTGEPYFPAKAVAALKKKGLYAKAKRQKAAATKAGKQNARYSDDIRAVVRKYRAEENPETDFSIGEILISDLIPNVGDKMLYIPYPTSESWETWLPNDEGRWKYIIAERFGDGEEDYSLKMWWSGLEEFVYLLEPEDAKKYLADYISPADIFGKLFLSSEPVWEHLAFNKAPDGSLDWFNWNVNIERRLRNSQRASSKFGRTQIRLGDLDKINTNLDMTNVVPGQEEAYRKQQTIHPDQLPDAKSFLSESDDAPEFWEEREIINSKDGRKGTALYRKINDLTYNQVWRLLELIDDLNRMTRHHATTTFGDDTVEIWIYTHNTGTVEPQDSHWADDFNEMYDTVTWDDFESEWEVNWDRPKISYPSWGDDVEWNSSSQRSAAVVFVHQPSGRIGLQLRSSRVNEPWTWAGVGGYIDSGESPEQCARREITEELGLELNYPLRLVSRDGGNFIFRMDVPDTFEPKLNWESIRFAWRTPEQWRATRNIHPELINDLSNRQFGAEDEWYGVSIYEINTPEELKMVFSNPKILDSNLLKITYPGVYGARKIWGPSRVIYGQNMMSSSDVPAQKADQSYLSPVFKNIQERTQQGRSSMGVQSVYGPMQAKEMQNFVDKHRDKWGKPSSWGGYGNKLQNMIIFDLQDVVFAYEREDLPYLKSKNPWGGEIEIQGGVPEENVIYQTLTPETVQDNPRVDGEAWKRHAEDEYAGWGSLRPETRPTFPNLDAQIAAMLRNHSKVNELGEQGCPECGSVDLFYRETTGKGTKWYCYGCFYTKKIESMKSQKIPTLTEFGMRMQCPDCGEMVAAYNLEGLNRHRKKCGVQS